MTINWPGRPILALLAAITLPGALAQAATVATATPADDSPLLPFDAEVAGRSQEDWSREWWQWAGSFDQRRSPVADRSGVLCASGQSGEVWFLAGTYGTQRTVRSCHVPAGKYLFFPLINYVVMPAPGGWTTCLRAQREALEITEDIEHLVLQVDGRRFDDLALHRQHTRECFDLAARGIAQGTATQRVFPSAADGYYVMLKPLPKGRHTVEFGGVLPGMSQAVSYTLIVD